MQSLSGRTALIVHGSGAVSVAIARNLAGAGAQVVLVDADAQKVADAAAAAGCAGLQADPGAADQLRGLPETLARRFSRPDILVFAPVAPAAPATAVPPVEPLDMRDSDWTELWTRSLLSAVRLSQAFVPAMRAAQWGRVVAVICPDPAEGAAMSAMNAATRSLFESLGRNAAGQDVLFAVVDASAADPDMAAEAVARAL